MLAASVRPPDNGEAVPIITEYGATLGKMGSVQRGVPSICYGLRGLAYLQVDVEGPAVDLHSGSFGGAVLNPANALARIIAGLQDASGKVLVPGFYDRVRKLTARERANTRRLPFSRKEWLASAGGPPAPWGEARFHVLERIWARPTLDVNGVWGGYQGEGAKTIIPAKAGAKISMRLVPDQTPEEIERKFTAYVKKLAPPEVKVTVRIRRSDRLATWLRAISAKSSPRNAAKVTGGVFPDAMRAAIAWNHSKLRSEDSCSAISSARASLAAR